MNNRIYFDNAATTSLDESVLQAMMPYLTDKFGNPSSIYSYGRETRLAVENARKSVAKILYVHPSEIFFTSGATESTNMALRAAVEDLGCKHIITSKIEHHATLHTAQFLAKSKNLKLSYVNLDNKGRIDYIHLEHLISTSDDKCLVTLMHGNNEIGNITDVEWIGNICEKYSAIFHTDMVQSIGHYQLDLKKIKAHFASSTGHKFHGPKGTGIIYVNEDVKIHPLINGGAQERNMRAGTENIYGIVGYAKALQLSVDNLSNDSNYINELKAYMIAEVKSKLPHVSFNGDPEGQSLYTVVSLNVPLNEKSEMLMFSLDMAGICISGGSACTSGSVGQSHVIEALYGENAVRVVPIRVSFSKHNTKAEIDIFINKMIELS